MKKLIRNFAALATVVCAAALTSCSEGDDGNGNVPSTPLAFADNATFDIPASTTGTAITDINVATGVSGGTTPYTFSATDLPAGITVSTAGIISGTPTTATAAGTATVEVEDNSSPGQTAQITINYGAVTAPADEPGTITFTTQEFESTSSQYSVQFTGRSNATIDWGDGTAPETVTTHSVSDRSYAHRFASTGAKTVTITGDILTLSFGVIIPSALDVTGMPGLLALSFSDGTLTSLDLSQNTLLEKLRLSGGMSLTSLDLGAQKALRSLIGGGQGCLVTSLDLSACKDLEEVHWPGENNINGQWGLTSINVSGLTKLKTLTIGAHHNLLALDVSGCIALESLHCAAQGGGSLLGSGHGRMTTLDAGGCASLKTINCFGQQISSLTLTGCTALERLDARTTRLASFDASGHPALNWLYVSLTDLADSPEAIRATMATLPARTGAFRGTISFGNDGAFKSFSIEGPPYYSDAVQNINAYLSGQGKNWVWGS